MRNGYLVAEIFNRYFPEHFSMDGFEDTPSLPTRLANWDHINRKLNKMNEITLNCQLVNETIHGKENAANLLMQDLYEKINSLKDPHDNRSLDPKIFTDYYYQQTLPKHMRSTASRTIQSNVKKTELQTRPDQILIKNKIEKILELNNQIIHQHNVIDDNPIYKKCVRDIAPD
ncbi:hypothetical protein SNEBB_003655 [Seison nebaliae]|nr:hypothetical protein SNEBB_003655 [Seison nebaliae]